MEALTARLDNGDHEYDSILSEFSRMEAGLSGERKLQHLLNDYPFKDDTEIFYSFECLNDNGFTHQIDALICTSRYMLIIEVKQISGTLFYKPHQHEFFRRTEAGAQENFLSPFDQAFRHQLFFENRLKLWNIALPIIYIVVIANVRAKLDHSLQNFPILHLSGMPSYLEKLHIKYAETPVKLDFLRKQLEQLYCPLPPRRTIERSRIRNGVLCEKCSFMYAMKYNRGYWLCQVCKWRSKEALKLALHQYRILIGPTITNSAFREFVGIERKEIASKLLVRSGMQQVGNKRGAYFVIPEDIFEKRENIRIRSIRKV